MARPSRSVRNRNPFNIIASEFARRRNAPDSDGDGFANFPSAALGFRAGLELLSGKSYRDLTIAQAVGRWAPPNENDTAAYVSSVCRQTGLSPNQIIGQLPAPQLGALGFAMVLHEGWLP